MTLTMQPVQKSASAMLPPMPTTSAGGDASQPAAGENPRISRWRRRTLRGINEIPQHAGAELKEEQKETFNSKRHPTVDATEVILEDMRRWYEDRLDHEDISAGWKQVQQCLFKKVTVRVPADDRRTTNLGAAQPEEESERQVMVVSKEFVARQVREVIRWREKWLDEKGLPRNTVMDEALQAEFLKASKDEYHNRPDQRELQKRDATDGGKQLVDGRKKARWNRNLQRLAGTAQMWQLLSFKGKFDPVFFVAEARAKRRLAIRYACLRAQGTALTRKQQYVLALYENGTLLRDAKWQ